MNRYSPMSSDNDVRETPDALYLSLDEEFKFDLDACATHRNTRCPLYFTEDGQWAQPVVDGIWRTGAGALKLSDADGLTGSWENRRVWCNPPYSDIGRWVNKAWNSRADLVVMLVPATRTEQSWWQNYVEPYRDCSRKHPSGFRLQTSFIPGRVHFLENGKPILRKNKDGSVWVNPKTGRFQRSSPKFGCVLLIFRRDA